MDSNDLILDEKEQMRFLKKEGDVLDLGAWRKDMRGIGGPDPGGGERKGIITPAAISGYRPKSAAAGVAGRDSGPA